MALTELDMDDFATFVAIPGVRDALLFVTTLFGSASMYAFSLNKGFEGALPFLKRVLPGRSTVFYHRSDFFVVVVAGSVIGTIFFQPLSPLQALAAGFGWVGALNVLVKKGPQQA